MPDEYWKKYGEELEAKRRKAAIARASQHPANRQNKLKQQSKKDKTK